MKGDEINLEESEFCNRLAAAVEQYDRVQIAALCDELIGKLRRRPDVYPAGAAKKILELLRKKRFFDLLQKTADAFIQSGQRGPRVRRLYAQALLDLGNLTAALNELKLLAADTQDDPVENAEACGLIGRTYKQIYVDADAPLLARNQESLAAAIKAYDEVYERDHQEYSWQGINVVALLHRAVRDGVILADTPNPGEKAEQIAQAILSEIKNLEAAQMTTWSLGTATEACVALNKMDQALEWCAKYVRSEHADAFELASTHRQFKEVWQLDPTSPILQLLEAELLKRQGGIVNLDPDRIAEQSQSLPAVKAKLEKVFGLDSFVSLDWYQKGLERCRSIAQIRTKTKRGVGTGFLICGKDIYEPWGDELILVTNSHVISPNRQVNGSLAPESAIVYFEALSSVNGQDVICQVEKILWTSPPEAYDATFARLNGQVGEIVQCELSPYLPLKDDNQRLYIIGHPAGGHLSFSIQDNLLLDYDEQLIHYRTPTEPGSSGSPVYNQEWELIGLHHRGGLLSKLNGQVGTYEANEGIWIQAIREAIRSDLAANSELIQ